jgi:hypothetical protein
MSNNLIDDRMKGGAASIRPAKPTQTPDHARCIEVTFPPGVTIGSRHVNCGEVVQIISQSKATKNIFPIDDQLIEDRARNLVSRGRARYHSGPATVNTVGQTYEDLKKTLGITIQAEMVAPVAERALSPRGKAGAL